MKKKLAIFAMGSALALSAQDVRLGVQCALSLPYSGLADNAELGLQLGGHARWDLNAGHGAVARADLACYGRNNGATVTGLAAAADYTYHFERRQRGLYALAGLSLQNDHTRFTGYSRNDNGLGIDLGVGYDLDRHLGLVARYTTNSFSDYTYAALNLGVSYTF